MPSQAPRLMCLFRILVLLGVAALLITSAALPTLAQNSVPPTAVQAARMPEFASKLHAPVGGAHLVRSPHGRTPASPQGQTLYDNGPYNGTTDAWIINFGFAVSDSFTVPSGSDVTGLSFVYWDASTSDLLTSVDMALGSSSFCCNFQTLYGVNNTFLGINQFGYALYQADLTFIGIPWSGSGYITLQNACTTSGCSVSNPVYWDENSGAGCMSPGCPSSAYENTIGSIPSESFTMEGAGGPPTCFESEGNLQIIHDFTPQQGPGAGVIIDKGGNLDGVTGGGDYGAGFAYRLDRLAGWLLDPLFSFLGGSSGGGPTGVLLGSNGTLYGGAGGGIQNCGSDGSQYCGLVFNLTPQPTVCRTAMCSWVENLPYRFSSESDGSGVINVSASDQEGNLYGTTTTGGAYDVGTVFELTPSGGGSWTKTILYSFVGGTDSIPTQVLVGNDGNLYGVTNGTYPNNGTVFELTPSGGQWTEIVLHAFSGTGGDGSQPSYLVQDSAGNLYGIVGGFTASALFVLEKTRSGWAFSENIVYHRCEPGGAGYDALKNLAIDAGGKLYGTGTGADGTASKLGRSSPGDGVCFYNYIFKAWHDSSGWHYQDLDFLDNTYFDSGGSLALDSSGKLYGTTLYCGAYNSGTVWQVSP